MAHALNRADIAVYPIDARGSVNPTAAAYDVKAVRSMGGAIRAEAERSI